MQLNVASDYEISRCETVFQSMVRTSPRCHEAYFGLGKNRFHLRQFDAAIAYL